MTPIRTNECEFLALRPDVFHHMAVFSKVWASLGGVLYDENTTEYNRTCEKCSHMS